MSGDLAGEERVHLAHPVLDEGVSHAVHERLSARPADRVRHGPARPDVVDHRAPRLLLEHHLREERGHEVAGDELARVVDEEAAVRVAVERHAEVGTLLQRLRDDELAVLGQERVRLVVREASVRVEVAADGLDGQAVEDRREHRAGHAVRGVDDDAQRSDRVHVDKGENAFDESGVDVCLLHGAALGGRRRLAGVVLGAVADLQEPGVAAHGERPAADDLHPRVLLRVVRRGDRDAAVEPVLADREVDHLGTDHPDVEDVDARVRGAADHRLRHRRRREPHVAPDSDPARLEDSRVRAADPVRAVLVELRRVDPADVVRLEDLRVERHGSVILGAVPARSRHTFGAKRARHVRLAPIR